VPLFALVVETDEATAAAAAEAGLEVLVGADVVEETEALPLGFPLAEDRMSRIAFAPKLIRRAKGDVGTLEVGSAPGSSSKGDSSTDPLLADETDSARVRAVPNGED
jgi:hypothetical protein